MNKFFGKGQQEWHKACLGIGMPPWKLKTLMKIQFASSKSFCFKRVWNPSLPLFFAMEGNNHWHFKVVCKVHKFGL